MFVILFAYQQAGIPVDTLVIQTINIGGIRWLKRRNIWSVIGAPVNIERGEWQISRVYSVLNRPQAALYHAERCLEICKENNIGDWDIAFAYEGIARAYAVAGKKLDCEKYIKLAKEFGEKIKEKGDKELFFSEIKTVHGYNER